MTIARTTGAFLGTSEGTGVTIANNATTTGSEIDILGNNTSQGFLFAYLDFTSTVTAGTLDTKMWSNRVTGQSYVNQAPLVASWAPINGTQLIDISNFQASRFMTVSVNNNATGANATNVFLGYELFQQS
jgi:hypothetical protein